MPEISGMIQQFLEGNIKTLSAEPVIESKTITENGTYTAPEGVDGYSPVVVNVPAPQPIIESKTITENGTYTVPSGVDGYSPVIVDVPPTQPVIQSKTITENGTYTAPSGVDGFSPVVVNVPLPPNAYLLKSVPNLPQAIASFNDGADAPMKSLKVAIEPQQEGSGDPSPDNIRPISGWDECNVTRCGVNVWDEQTEIGIYNQSTGEKQNDTGNSRSVNKIRIEGGTQYYFKLGQGLSQARVFYYTANSYISNTLVKGLFTPPNNAEYMTFQFSGTTYNHDISINYPSNDTSYHAYNGQTYTIDLDGTRYGGTLDVVNGVLTLTHGYIASYNGETLPSTWISDRDVYEEGTTPTIGAEVCYELATPLTIQLTPTAVKSLPGSNNVWADTGDITDAEYFSKEV